MFSVIMLYLAKTVYQGSCVLTYTYMGNPQIGSELTDIDITRIHLASHQ